MTSTRLPSLALLTLVVSAAALAIPPEQGSRATRGPGTLRPGGSSAVIRPTRSYRETLRSTSLTAGEVQLPKLLYYGGKVMTNVRIIPVLWGSVDPAFRTRLDAFYKSFAVSEQFDYAAEFSTVGVTSVDGKPGTNQVLGKGTSVSGILIAPLNASISITSGDLTSELLRDLAAGTLPANDENTLYMIHLPPGITVRDPGQLSCREYCAYHDSFDRNGVQVRFALIPDHSTGGCFSGCGEDTDFFNNMSASASHEVMEAITDPDVGAGNFACGPAWCDPLAPDQASSHSENGDICAASLADLRASDINITEGAITGADNNRIVVQREWTNRSNACITVPKDAFSLTVEPASQQIHGPGTYTFKLKTTVPPGGPLPIRLGTYTLPSGISASVTPSTATTGADATLTLNIAQLNAASINFAVWAESGRALAMALGNVGTDDFRLTSGPTVKLTAGSTATTTIDTASVSGSTSQTLTLLLTGKPPGVTIQGTPPQITSGQSVTVTVAASAGTPSLTGGKLTFTLSNGLNTHSVLVPIDLAGDDFTAAHDVGSALIVPTGGSSTFHIVTTTPNGNPQPLTFSAKSLPDSLSASFDPPSLQSGGTTKVTVKGNGAPVGAGQIVIGVAGANASTDIVVNTMVQSAGCGSSAPGALAPAALFALSFAASQARRRRRPAM